MSLTEDYGKRRKLLVNLVVLIVSFYFYVKANESYQPVSMFDNFMISSFAPMQKALVYGANSIRDFFSHYMLSVRSSKENVQLKKEIASLEEKIFGYEEVALENSRLKQLMAFGEGIPSKRVLAQIVGWDASSSYKKLRINKGTNDGVVIKSPIITAQGLVGYVFRVTAHYSDVLTILDPNNRVDVLVQRTRTHGVLEGYFSNRCLMKYVARTEPLVLNDQVVTSGLGRIYPKGVHIGSIAKIGRESYGITQEIEVIPSVEFGKLEEVVVLVLQDLTTLEKEWKVLESTNSN